MGLGSVVPTSADQEQALSLKRDHKPEKPSDECSLSKIFFFANEVEEDDVYALVYQALAALATLARSGHYGVSYELEDLKLTGEGDIYFKEKKTIMEGGNKFVTFLGFVADNFFHIHKIRCENGNRQYSEDLDAMLTARKSRGNKKIERVLKFCRERLGDDAPSASAHYREKIKALVENTKRQGPQTTSAE
jgi:hypothetical protein